MDLSFSLSSQPSSAAAAAATRTPQSLSDDHMAADSDPKPEYVTVFNSSKPLASSSDLVIPPIPNSNFTTRLENLIYTTGAGASNQDLMLVVLRQIEEDMNNLPKHRGMEEYTKVSVEKFGDAYLAGNGLKESMDVDTEEVQCDLSILKI